jgi:hypothetical protein
MTVRFRDFMESLKIGEDTANNLRRTFAGFFAILGIGWELLKAGIGFLAQLIGKFHQGSGGVLEFTGNIGDFLVGIHKAIKDGQLFVRFFDKVNVVLDPAIEMLRKLAHFIGGLFDDFDGKTAGDAFGRFVDDLGSVSSLGDKIALSWENVKQVFLTVIETFEPMASKMADWAAKLSDFIHGIVGGMSAEGLTSGLSVGILAAVLGGLIKVIRNFGGIFRNFAGIPDMIQHLTGTLSLMHTQSHADHA